jgi:hypothetical protein
MIVLPLTRSHAPESRLGLRTTESVLRSPLARYSTRAWAQTRNRKSPARPPPQDPDSRFPAESGNGGDFPITVSRQLLNGGDGNWEFPGLLGPVKPGLGFERSGSLAAS